MNYLDLCSVMQECQLVAAAMVEYRVCAIDIWRTDVLDGVMEVDGTCNIKQANKDACTMFGYPAAGMKTLNLSRLFQLAGDRDLCPAFMQTSNAKYDMTSWQVYNNSI